jgi:hypothetical protein
VAARSHRGSPRPHFGSGAPRRSDALSSTSWRFRHRPPSDGRGRCG